MLFDTNEVLSYGVKRKLDKKKRKKIAKLQNQGILIGKDPTKLLDKAMKKLNNCNTDTIVSDADQLMRTKWKIATLRAQGYKVKDNLSLIKKSAEKVKKIKKKRYLKWQERIKHVEHQKAEKQAKRVANIQARKNSKLSKKLKKARVKGRVFSINENQLS